MFHGLHRRGAIQLGIVLVVASIFVSTTRSEPAPPNVAGDSPISAEYKQYEWKNGDKPVKMLAKEEGFCFLTEVCGHFAGAGEVVHVYIGDDGFWYLGGSSGQPDLSGKAMSVKFVHRLKAAIIFPDDPNASAWTAELAAMASGNNQAIKNLVDRERRGLPDDPAAILSLAKDWELTTRADPDARRRLVEAHFFGLYEIGISNLTGRELDETRVAMAPICCAVANRRLNDLRAWHAISGKWSQVDGRIEGRGDSGLRFDSKLPADCLIEWRMKVTSGMRPRVWFEGTEAYFGNEGFMQTFELHNGQFRREVPVQYANGQEVKVGVKLSRESMELYVDGELMAKCDRKSIPPLMGLRMSAGDDWSPGVVQFWDFKASPIR